MRRVFLETLASDIALKKDPDTKLEKLKGIKAEIAGRTKTIKTSIRQKTTALGRWFGFAVTLVPMGGVLLGKVNYDELIWPWEDGYPDPQLVIGSILAAAPALILFINLIRVCFKPKKKRADEWRFLQSDSLQRTTQDINEGPDQTSVEFERFFERIVNVLTEDFALKKIILVIDNLDRIAAEEALKIWAVLQTFLQQRNQAEPATWFDQVWVIIPYDHAGLTKLWDTEVEKGGFVGKSFFDKSFQLRLDVPKPIFKDWEGFAKKQMDIALTDWERKDCETILRILRIARSDLNDILTPREIKNYINQVALIAHQRQGTITLDAIAYYVNWREILNADTATIRDSLLKFQLAQPKHTQFLDRERIIPEIAALCFGVSLLEANRFLLSPLIFNALKSGDETALGKLVTDHESSFWAAFENLRFQPELGFILTASKAIYLALWGQYSTSCDFFLKQIDHFPEGSNVEHFETSVIDYSFWIQIARNPQAIYNFLLKQIDLQLQQSGLDWKERGQELEAVFEAARGRLPNLQMHILPSLDLGKTIEFARACLACENLVALIQPPQAIIQEFMTAIAGNQNQLADLNLVVRYLHNTRQNIDWNPIMEACTAAVYNAAIGSQGFIYLVLLELASISPDLSKRVGETVANLRFYMVLSNPVHPAAAFVWHLFTSKEFPVFTGRPSNTNAAANQGAIRMRNFWVQENEQNATAILHYHETYGYWPEFWQLTKRAEWLLVRGILRRLVDSTSLEISLKNARIQDVFENLQFRDADIMEKLVKGFHEYGDLEMKLLAYQDIRAPFLLDVVSILNNMDISESLKTQIGAI